MDRLQRTLLVLLGLAVWGGALSDSGLGASARDQIGAADGFFLNKEYEFALTEYANFLAAFPNHAEAPRATFQLGECYYRLKKYEQAVPAFERLAGRKNLPQSLRVKTLYRLGESESHLKHWAKAARAYGRLVTEAPKNPLAPAALSAKSEALYKLRRFQDVAAACEQLIRDYPNNKKYVPVAWYSLGWARFELRDYAQAAAAFAALVKNFPKHAAAAQSQLKLGECYYELKDHRKALAAYQKVLRDYPGEWSDEARMGVGSCHFALQAYDAAARAFEKVAAEYPKAPLAPLALLNAARSYLEAGKPDRALAAADQFDAKYAQTPVAPRMAATRARALLEQKKYDEAAKRFAAALRAGLPASERPAARFGLGEAHFGARRFKEALAAYETVVSESPKHPLAEDAAYSIVFCHAELGDLRRAVRQCRTFRQAHPKSRLLASVCQAEGEYRYRLKDYAGARDACLESLRLDATGPYADDATYKLGWSYRQLGDHRKAREQFLKLAERFPKSPYAAEGLYMAGESAAALGDVPGAARLLETCEKRFPRSEFAANAAYRLALLHYEKKAYREAAAKFADFIRKYPKNPLVERALAYAGEAEFQLGRYTKARDLYARQLARFPAGGQWGEIALYGLAWCDRKAGKMAAAAAVFQKLAARYPSGKRAPESRFWAARCLEDDKKFAAAADRFADFVKKHPTHPLAEEAAYRIGRCRFEAGQHDKARADLESFVRSRPKSSFADNALYDLAWCHKKTKQPGKAVAAYETLLRDYPQSDVLPYALFELGNLHFDARRLDAAIERYRQAAAKAKKIPDLLDRVYYKLGLAYDRKKAPAQVAETFAKLIAECPRSELVPEAYYRLGDALRKQGKTKEAIQAFTRCIRAKPAEDFVELSMYGIAECHRADGAWAKGLAAYNAALQRFPKSPWINEMLYGKGQCAQHLGAYKDAMDAYQAVIAATGTVTAARAQYGIAECYLLQRRYKEAMKEFLKIDILYGYDEECAAGLYMAGQCAEKLKDKERARRYYRKILAKPAYKATAYGAKAQRALEGVK